MYTDEFNSKQIEEIMILHIMYLRGEIGGVKAVFDELCKFGPGCCFGKGVEFGDHSTFEKACYFGEECYFGGSCTFQTLSEFSDGCEFGEQCEFGSRCKFGDDSIFWSDCFFGEGCEFVGNVDLRGSHTFSKGIKWRNIICDNIFSINSCCGSSLLIATDGKVVIVEDELTGFCGQSEQFLSEIAMSKLAHSLVKGFCSNLLSSYCELKELV